MTIIEAIQKTDELKPNGYTQSQKIEWLSKLDGIIKRGIIDTHEGGDEFLRGKVNIVAIKYFTPTGDDTPRDGLKVGDYWYTTEEHDLMKCTVAGSVMSPIPVFEIVTDQELNANKLYEHDGKLYILNIGEGALEETSAIPFFPYTDKTPLETELLAYAPFDEMYIFWLESKIDYANAEYAHYNNSVTHFNDIYTAFRNDYNRTHMPKGGSFKYF